MSPTHPIDNLAPPALLLMLTLTAVWVLVEAGLWFIDRGYQRDRYSVREFQRFQRVLRRVTR